MPEQLFYFPWEVVEVPYRVKPGSAARNVRVYTKGVASEDNFEYEGPLETTPGDHKFKLGPLGDSFPPELSPLFVKFDPGVEAGKESFLTRLEEKFDELLRKKDIKTSFALDFGNDSLTITASTEGGLGAGVGDEVGTGGSATGTGAARFYTVKPKFPIGMILADEETLVICIRFVLRFFYHFCDAVNLSIDWWKKLPKGRPHDWPSNALGYYWWLNVFSVFAIKDALEDMVADHASFVAKSLQKLGFEFELNLNAALSGTALVNIDASYAAVGRCFVPLGTLLSPVIQFLCAGAPKPASGEAGLADLIEPRIEAKANDHFCLKVGGFPVAFEIESRGTLAEGSFCIPKGSPLRKKVEDVGRDLAEAADAYKNSKLQSIRDEMKLPRMILDLLDAEVRNMIRLMKAGKKLVKHAKSAREGLEGGVTADEAKAGYAKAGEVGADARETQAAAMEAYQTAGPHVKRIMDYLQGRPPAEEPRGIGAKAEAVLRMLREVGIRGVAIEPGSPLRSAEEGDRKRLWIHVDDAEKAKVEAVFAAPEPPAAVLEDVTFRVPLPVRPLVVGWDDYVDPQRDRSYSGIVAGFDLASDARAFLDRRKPGQVPPELARVTWTREARFWAWVETGLVPYLTASKIPLPELSLDESGAMLLTFDEMEIGRITEADVAPLPGAMPLGRKTIWKVALMTAATTDEVREIEEQVDRNQPDDDPYATPGLDAFIATTKGWGAPAGAKGEAGDAAASRFESLGAATPTHGPRRRAKAQAQAPPPARAKARPGTKATRKK